MRGARTARTRRSRRKSDTAEPAPERVRGVARSMSSYAAREHCCARVAPATPSGNAAVRRRARRKVATSRQEARVRGLVFACKRKQRLARKLAGCVARKPVDQVQGPRQEDGVNALAQRVED